MASKKHRKKQSTSSIEPSSRTEVLKPTWSERNLVIGLRIGFIIFCLAFLGVVNRDYLFVVQEYSLFLDTGTFFLSHAGHVGGLLQYGSSFMTQFFLEPAFGAVLLTAILLLIQTLTARLFRLHGPWTVLSYLPSFLLIRIFTQLEHRIFNVFIYPNDLYSCVLGTLAALLFAGTYARISNPFGRFGFGAAGCAAIYWVAGVFGLLGLLLCVIREFGFPNADRRSLRQELLVLCGLLVPLSYYLLFLPAPISLLYFIGIPVPHGLEDSYSVFVFLLATPVALAVFDVCRGGRTPANDELKDRKVSIPAATIGVILFSAFTGATIFFSHANAEFLTTVKMCRLLKQRDWEGILRIRFDHPEPIRPIIWMRNLALFKLGRLGDEAFSFPQGFDRRISIRHFDDAYVFGNVILYEFGFINTSFKTAHNQYVSRGINRNGLETMALCSLINDENKLAERYLRLMRQAPVLKRHAKSLVSAEAVESQSAIRLLIPKEDRFERPMAMMDPLILDGFLNRSFENAPPEVREMLLFTMLLRKDLKNFRNKIDFWFEHNSSSEESFRIPKHFQEAILLGSPDFAADIEKYRLSSEIVDRYREFETFRKTVTRLTSSNDGFRRQFGDTYWFYHAVREFPASLEVAPH